MTSDVPYLSARLEFGQDEIISFLEGLGYEVKVGKVLWSDELSCWFAAKDGKRDFANVVFNKEMGKGLLELVTPRKV